MLQVVGSDNTTIFAIIKARALNRDYIFSVPMAEVGNF